MRLALWLSYDGTNFRGFAPNPGVATVTGALVDALRVVCQGEPVLTCAGRTDSGVHGRAQVVTVDLPIDPDTTLDLHAVERSVNGLCRPDIVVWHVAEVPESFDARFSAKSRSYRYTVLNRRLPDPLRRGRVWHVWDPLDVAPMNAAAQLFVGTHDFSSFCRRKIIRTREGDVEATRMRTVRSLSWSAGPGPGELTFEICATSFCQQMVRSIVGLLVDVGRGRLDDNEVRRIMAARSRREVSTVAPPEGLILWEVGYDVTPETAVFLPPPSAWP